MLWLALGLSLAPAASKAQGQPIHMHDSPTNWFGRSRNEKEWKEEGSSVSYYDGHGVEKKE